MKSNKIIESSISLMLAHPGPQGPSAPGASVARSVSIKEKSSRLREGRGCGDLEDVCIQMKNTQQTRLQLPSASGPAGWKPRSETHHPSPPGSGLCRLHRQLTPSVLPHSQLCCSQATPFDRCHMHCPECIPDTAQPFNRLQEVSVPPQQSPLWDRQPGVYTACPACDMDGFELQASSSHFPGGSDDKESACNTGDLGLIAGSGRSSGERHAYPLQYLRLVNSMGRGAWRAIAHGGTRVGHIERLILRLFQFPAALKVAGCC